MIDNRVIDYDLLVNGSVDKAQYSKGHGLLMLKVPPDLSEARNEDQSQACCGEHPPLLGSTV
jgi:hypothetical protein